MGDRNNPIKFGPEWLRNLPRERSTGNSNPQSSPAAAGAAASAAGGSGAAAAGSSTNTNTNTPNTANSNKVQLAKLRYGREEMLALYDRTAEAPLELKHIDALYQTRGKPPVALNNTFEEDMRDRDARTGPSIGGMLPGERFGTARSLGRGLSLGDGRGRPRMPFVRQTSAGGRGASWHGSPRMPGYTGAEEEPPTVRSWNNSSGNASATRNSSGDPSDWNQNKVFRSKRQGTSTNWRQPTRDDDEWRGQESSRARSSQQEKWERDWGDRQQDKPPSWSSNRRTWVGGEGQSNDDNLPEWATDGAEACAGTFDSSGAFHGGYSNDDTNLPKNPETAFPLTRSHTHGSFVRSKTVEEGSEEWWASEKAKKLSPKRFDASEIKFKKTASNKPEMNTSSNTNTSTNKEDSSSQKAQEKSESPGAAAAVSTASDTTESNMDDSMKRHLRFSQSKTFDSLMRPDINMEEASDERSNFQSVMITPNNSLRTKHQNIVATSVMLDSNKDSRQPCMMPYNPSNQVESDDNINEILDMTLEDKDGLLMPSGNDGSLVNSASACISSGMSTMVNSMSQMPIPMQLGISNAGLANQGMQMNDMSNMPSHGMHPGGMQQVGITNSALNASLGLPLGGPSNPINQTMGILPLQGVPPPVLPNPGMNTSGMPSSVSGMPGYPPSSGLPGMPNVGNNSLFLGQNSNNSTLQSPPDIPMPNHGNPGNMFPLHNLQHPSNPPFGSSVYSNMMQHNVPPPSSNAPNYNLADHWFYEDPKKDIQGPFTSKDMYSWYRAGFFSPSLMVRRACDNVMRPLGSYGPVVPFAPMDMMLAMSGRYEPRNQTPQGLGLDVAMNMPNLSDPNSMQFGTVGLMRNPPFPPQPMVNSGFNGAAREGEPRRAPPEVDSLWGQPSPPELLWMQAMNTQRNDNRVNNLPMFFWDQQPSAIASNSLLPEEIAKEMKTEDQILAQLRASQNINQLQNLHFMNDSAVASPAPPPAPAAPAAPPPAPSKNSEDPFAASINNAPNLEDLQNFIQEDTLKNASASDNYEPQLPQQLLKETTPKDDPTPVELNNSKSQSQVPNKASETKILKQTKNEIDKTKNKEINNTKNKNKKSKDEKKDDSEIKNKDDDTIKLEKKSEESSPVKNKKEDKQNKKDIEKEKKEWLKDGFTIVKGTEKTTPSKKKNEEPKATEEAERKRKEEERLAAEEEKQRKQVEALKRQQEAQQMQQRQILESVSKRAPWSASGGRDGPTLAEIQRLEREKKLEQIKEQQHMMQIIAQQQAAALAREQEVQAGLGWAKKKNAMLDMPGQSLAEIQAEARMQAASAASAAAAAAAAAAIAQAEEARALSPTLMNMSPWGNTDSVGGFWDTPPSQPIKPQATKSLEQTKSKKKAATLNLPPKKEVTPAVEFESWCTTILASWSAKIDVPTFVGFLKDIESPYEVKDYVKCYLGESKETGDFARQFLERRSKLLRVGMVTPSDDLCSPALAVNPRTVSGSDYQEVKGKGKKTKKNKMLKVDARILGFSVTAAEDRINVGDIDTA